MKIAKTLVVILLFILLCVPVGASDELDSLKNSLPQEVSDKLPDGAFDENALPSYDFAYFIKQIIASASDTLTPAALSASKLLGVIILASVIRAMRDSVTSERLSAPLNMCLSVCTALCIYSTQLSVFTIAGEFIKNLTSIVNVMLPVMTGVYIAGGNITQAAVTGTALMLGIAVCTNLFSSFVIPALRVSFVLAAFSGVGGNPAVSSLSSLVRKLVTAAVCGIMTVYSFVLSLQTMLAKNADSFGSRAVKFASSSFVPIVGSAVSDAMSAVSAGVSLIKSSVGAIGIVSIVIVMLPIAVTLFVSKLSLSLCGSAAASLGCHEESKLISSISSIFTVIAASVISVSVLFILAFALFLNSAPAYGG